ncbi:MAG: protein kinase [Candidatus Doudnabacteria bacterium]|nr:protein kinase [Candidatus Doudnabacteria bacterium]
MTIIGAGYTITPLENGGQKQVFHITDGGDHDEVLKFVKIEEFDEDEEEIIVPLSSDEERTRREVRLMSSVTSLYLPTLGTIGLREYSKGGLKYLVFSELYIGDKSVKDLIREGFFNNVPRVKALAHDIANALVVYSNFEDGFVHRDIKPGNVVYSSTTDKFVLIDSGIHLLPSSPTITSSHAFLGTQKYASPEQLTQGRRFMDSRSDLFSLGVLLYEAAAGVHPFYKRGQSVDIGLENHINAVFDPIPATSEMHAFTPILERMLTKHAHTRYTTPEDLLLDIEGVEG